jgi:hypothetical protein
LIEREEGSLYTLEALIREEKDYANTKKKDCIYLAANRGPQLIKGIDKKHCIPWVEFESNNFMILNSGGELTQITTTATAT